METQSHGFLVVLQGPPQLDEAWTGDRGSGSRAALRYCGKPGMLRPSRPTPQQSTDGTYDGRSSGHTKVKVHMHVISKQECISSGLRLGDDTPKSEGPSAPPGYTGCRSAGSLEVPGRTHTATLML